MVSPPLNLPPSALASFLELYHRGEFWESHEVLEGPWRALRSDFYHGLILYASAWVHWNRGNAHGVGAQLRKALDRLAPLPDVYLGLDVAGVRLHCRVGVGVVAKHPDDWGQRLGPLVLRFDPARVRGDEMEWVG